MLSCIRDVQSMVNVWTELGDLSVWGSFAGRAF